MAWTKEDRNEWTREWRARNPKNVMVAAAKSRAKKANLDFNLTVETCPDIPKVCPILGIELIPKRVGTKGSTGQSPTLDRIDNTKGYVDGNCRVISYSANVRKGDMTPEQIERLYLYSKGEL